MKTRKVVLLGMILVLMTWFVLPVGCAEQAPTLAEVKTFAKYGFSFEYPQEFSITEMGMLENEANDNSGRVLVGEENGESHFFQVGYVKTMEWSLEVLLGAGVRALEASEEVASVKTNELLETTTAGHRTLGQYYTATSTEGDKAYGIIGSFYCDKSQKGFTLMTITNTISAKQGIFEDLQSYLDSFICH